MEIGFSQSVAWLVFFTHRQNKPIPEVIQHGC